MRFFAPLHFSRPPKDCVCSLVVSSLRLAACGKHLLRLQSLPFASWVLISSLTLEEPHLEQLDLHECCTIALPCWSPGLSCITDIQENSDKMKDRVFSECAPMVRSKSIWTYTFNIMMTFNLDWNYCALFPLVNPKWRYSVLCKSACYTRQFHVQCTCTLYSFPSDFFDHPLLPLQCKVSVVFKGTLHWIPLWAPI